MTLTTGQVLQSRYRIVSLLGQGGMGAVYRAWDTRLNAPVALKEMIPQPGTNPHTLAQLRQQFQQEAIVLSRLNHPHLVGVTDFFEEGDNDYLVIKFIEGESLADRIKREGALPEGEVLAWAKQLLDALAYCHSQGVIHRDVKPQNVIIRPVGPAPPRFGGARGGAVLVDFGLVKLWDPHDPRTKTAMRGMGTPEYAPPEQYDTQMGHTDPRSDIYSLGALLYHALTGQAPPTAVLRIANWRIFEPPRALNQRILPTTETAVLRAMELGVEDRFPTAREMAAALSGKAIVTRQTLPQQRPTRIAPEIQPGVPSRRRVPMWTWALGGAFALALAMAGAIMGIREMKRQPPANHTPTVVAAILPTNTSLVTLTSLPPTNVRPTSTPQPGTSEASPPANALCGDTWPRPKDGMTMVYIPAGIFLMGSESGEGDEQPVHEVSVDGFWIDQLETTNAAFEQFVSETGYQTDADRESWGSIWRDSQWNRIDGLSWCHPNDPDKGISAMMDHPVVQASWNDANAYCEWVGGHLPTEAEWEMAAVGTTGWKYPWGNELDPARLNAAGGGTVRAGSYENGRSHCGTYDIAGNVWEWVSDWYQSDYYSISPSANPRGPAISTYKALRGGGWDPSGGDSRSADRGSLAPDSRGNTIGFRCAWDPTAPSLTSATLQPTPTSACPAVSGPFTAVWGTVQDTIGCATGSATSGLVAEEHFEGGKMFWREPIDYAQALVLFNDGTWRVYEHAPFVEGSPEFSCPDANTPSQCPPTPKRGFGMMWCDISEIRDLLGKATDCERGYQGSMQQFERGFMIQTDSGDVYVFYENGDWERR